MIPWPLWTALFRFLIRASALSRPSASQSSVCITESVVLSLLNDARFYCSNFTAEIPREKTLWSEFQTDQICMTIAEQTGEPSTAS